MNTRRCELCGTLYGREGGYMSVSVPRSDVNYHTHDHYNLCEACSLKVYDMVEGLKTSDGKKPAEQSALTDLIQRQNAEIARIRMCLRNANNELFNAQKFEVGIDNSRRMLEHIDSATKWIFKAELGESD